LDDAVSDIVSALRKYHLAGTFGWQDVAQRYRRSKIGAFWLSINMAVLIGALGVIFGTLFRSPMNEFLPYLCVSLIVWGVISTSLSEGCTTFIAAEGIILQVRMPLFTHIMRVLWRNAIIFAHNLVIVPIVFLVFGKMPGWGVFLAVPGFVLLALNLLWMMLILSTVCARFRDMTMVVQNILQVLVYATPVMWMPSTLPSHLTNVVLYFNPFYHLMTVVRAPILGQPLDLISWAVVVTMAIVGWLIALSFFSRYRRRVPYWL